MSSSALGALFVVATPIGTLDDITVRALRVLRDADGILAEDTRRTRTLTTHHGIATRVESFHAHTGDERVARLVARLKSGERLALVSDAGTPVISDPGIRLIDAASRESVPIHSVPGPSAVTAALSVAGLRCDSFRFVGFLPRKGSRRRRALDELSKSPEATVLFESPNRLSATLRDLSSTLRSDRRLAVCREVTKIHEEVIRGTAGELSEHFDAGTRGEITVIVEAETAAAPAPSPADFEDEIRSWLKEGMGTREAADRLAEVTGLSRREAYQHVLSLARQD